MIKVHFGGILYYYYGIARENKYLRLNIFDVTTMWYQHRDRIKHIVFYAE
jgi:hypothetical protein